MYTQANFQILGRPGPDRRSIRYGLAHDGHVAALMRPGHAPGFFWARPARFPGWHLTHEVRHCINSAHDAWHAGPRAVSLHACQGLVAQGFAACVGEGGTLVAVEVFAV